MNRLNARNTSYGPLVPSAMRHFYPISRLKNCVGRMIGAPIESGLGKYWEMVERVKAIHFSDKTNEQLAERTSQLACFFRAGQILSNTKRELLLHKSEIELFALVREASRRAIGLDPFDVQLIAGMAMACGCIAELPTGEGKTLAAVFTACLRALSGEGVHVLTFNDYLARRDAAWMAPVYRMLGLTVGCIQEGMSLSEKRDAYACDVTYATAKEAGFDFLRDQIAYDRDALVHRRFNFAILDEADSILIDEARIPLVISGAEERASWDAGRLASIVNALIPEREFEMDAEHRNVFLTEDGIERLEAELGCGSLYVETNQSLLEAIYCALHARALLRRDVDYIVCNDHIKIVDEYTGRVVEKRHWPDGLQAAVEAKEGLSQKTQARILGSITLQHFFRLYSTISGMTATAQSSAEEFFEFYGMKVVVIPPHTASIRVDHPDLIFRNREAKRRAVVQEIQKAHTLGRPVLVGTASILESEEFAKDLRAAGVGCRVLNAKNDELEASIIAEAGMPGAVTISTNMAGRGVDIKLGGNDERYRDAVTALGGLYIIGTNRHESLRIDRQLRGRAGRQGDSGATRFFISMEDDLFVRYGLTEGLQARYQQQSEAAISLNSIRREIAHAQRIIEGQNFDIRRFLCKFSSLVELQRRIIQARREECLVNPEMPELSLCSPELYEEGLQCFGPAKMMDLVRSATLFHIDRLWSDHLAWIQDTRDSIHFVNLGGREPLSEFCKWATDEFLRMQTAIDAAVNAELASVIRKKGPVNMDLERLKGPSSTWTYLINENQSGWGVEMTKGKNIGFVKLAFGSPAGLLFLLMMYLERRSRRKHRL
jgi:preprotein translocase subunit SecA